MAHGRKTGGRQKGTPNRATADIKELAHSYGPAVIAELARMSGVTDAPGAQTEAVRLAAMRELLDRGYGRAVQHMSANVESSAMLLHLVAAREVASQLPMIDAKPEAVDTRKLHPFDQPEE
jgi:hypothetical protein